MMASDPAFVLWTACRRGLATGFPAEAQLTLALLEDEGGSDERIVEQLEHDARSRYALMLAANLGQAPGRPPIKSIRHALGWLGRRQCQSFLWMVLIGDQIQNWHGLPHQARNRLFSHALATAVLAHSLVAAGRPAEWALAAGMAHDVGHLLVLTPGAQLDVVGQDDSGVVNRALPDQPRECNHARLGQELLALWNAPAALQAAAEFHHAPEAAPAAWRELVAAVRLADLAAGFLDQKQPRPATMLFGDAGWQRAARLVDSNAQAELESRVAELLPVALLRWEQLAHQLAL